MGYDRATDDQKEAVKAFVLGKDVFVSLPTGSGKSLCYSCLIPCSSFVKHGFFHTKSVCLSIGPGNTNPGFHKSNEELPDSVAGRQRRVKGSSKQRVVLPFDKPDSDPLT